MTRRGQPPGFCASRLRQAALWLIFALPLASAKAQPPAGMPDTIKQSEGRFAGTWTWNGREYIARWNNLAIAKMKIKGTFSPGSTISVDRADTPNSSTAGLTAVYTGQISAQGDSIVNGKVTWTFRNGGKNTGTWSASWNSSDCSKQVQVNTFAACAHCPVAGGSLGSSVPGSVLRYNKKGNELKLFTVATFLAFPLAGIKFYADVHINNGALPIDTIHVRYINNLIAFNGSENYDSPPNYRPILGGGAAFPVLDILGTYQGLPYYGTIPEQPPTGADRTLEENDSPEVSAFITRKRPKGQLESINVVKGFTTYLGCTLTMKPLLPFEHWPHWIGPQFFRVR